MTKSFFSSKSATGVLFTLVIVLSYFTYFHKYWEPAALFWDENYHIASAQKYLNQVFFMEQHPPLGKLLIAAGEKIFSPNERTDYFVNTDYGREIPAGFSFVGYRFFPALLGWLTAPLLFLAFWFITKNGYYSFFLSFLYIFDNAQIVHNRGAMLEGPLIFFTVATIVAFLWLLERMQERKSIMTLALLLGICAGLAFMTKYVGLVMILLLPALLLRQLKFPKQMITTAGMFMIGFLAVFSSVWYVHFALGDTINTEAGTYQASEEYKQILAQGTNESLANFPLMLADSLQFTSHYNRGVPTLNLCKADENGSPFFYWPLGARTISYRWNTPDSINYQYLYLVPNPIGWWLGFLGVVLAVAYLIHLYVFGGTPRSRNHFLILTFLAVYLGYMGAISRIDRVMYLYHYFIPLVMSYLLFGLMFLEIRSIGTRMLNPKERFSLLIGIGTLVVASFLFYSPLTYYKFLNQQQFELRNIFSLWDMECVNCPTRDTFYFPTSD